MFKINIVCTGSLKEKFFISAQEEYLKRLQKFCDVKIYEFAEEKLSQNPSASEIEKALDREYEKYFPALKGKIVVCAVEGKEFSSEQFSLLLKKYFDETGVVTFLLGSSYGLSSKAKTNANLLSFSPMTLPHHLARIVLEEQIYRAFSIISGSAYHK